MKLYPLAALSLACLCSTALTTNAQVSVRAPFVNVDVGGGAVRVRAPFVNVFVPTSSPRYTQYPPTVLPVQQRVIPPQGPVFPAPTTPYQPQLPPPVPQVQPPATQIPAPQVYPQTLPVPTPQVVPAQPILPPKVIYETAPMSHKKFATVFRPCAGRFEVDLVHPGLCKNTVHVCFDLPPGQPCVRVGHRHIEFDYGHCSVEIVFALFGKVRVEYD